MPTPIGVEIEARYGTSRRVPLRGKPNLGFTLRSEISDKKMFRIVSGNREELSRAYHDLPLIAFIGMSHADTLEG